MPHELIVVCSVAYVFGLVIKVNRIWFAQLLRQPVSLLLCELSLNKAPEVVGDILYVQNFLLNLDSVLGISSSALPGGDHSHLK